MYIICMEKPLRLLSQLIKLNMSSCFSAAVSFEDLPSTSSLEGLQAAHDRIKVAPKHRRPPTRVRCNSSSMNPLNSGKMKPHRRSKTDPQDFTVKPKVESNSSSDVTTAIFKSQETNEEQRKEKHFADLKAKAESVITNSSPTNTEMLVSDKEGKDLKKEEKNKQKCAKDGSADSEMKYNKENQTDSKNRLVHENTAEEKKCEDKILKELNNKNEEYRLNLKKRSESLDVIEPKSKSGSEICPDTEADTSTEPQKRSFESKEKSSHRDVIVRKELENEKLVKTSFCRENQPANPPTNNVSISKMEPVVSTSTGLDEKSSLGSKASAGKETNSEQKAGFRPAMKKRSESLDVVETKGKSGPEIGSHTGAVSKPQVRRGFSLDSVESTEKTSDFKVRKLVMEKQKLGGTSVCKNNQSANTQTKNQTEVNLDEKNLLGPKESDKEASSIQPSWVELANQRSKRLSQLLNEDVKETNSQVKARCHCYVSILKATRYCTFSGLILMPPSTLDLFVLLQLHLIWRLSPCWILLSRELDMFLLTGLSALVLLMRKCISMLFHFFSPYHVFLNVNPLCPFLVLGVTESGY